MALKYSRITGTKDILPDETPLWRYVEESARKLFHRYGYEEIRTPILENTELFARSVGADTDIVEKEMYTFTDRDEKSVSLRPEETAGVIRAYLENGMYSQRSFWKLYYIGPMFRRERPQQGRFRQFHQIGAELIGSYSPNADFETVKWLVEFFKMFNITAAEVNINSAGCAKCRPGYIMRLKEAIDPRINDMCPDCRRRHKRNIFRLLDCKQEQCGEIIKELPAISDCLCPECDVHFREVKRLLDNDGINYSVNPRLVRGIDYYNRTVYEIIHSGLGSQNAVAAGGRYDLLSQEMGGAPAGAVGFSIGVERFMALIDKTSSAGMDRDGRRITAYLISMDKESYDLNFVLLTKLRSAGISSDIDYEGKSLKAQMRAANRLGASYAVIRGGEEIKYGLVTLKNMMTGEEKKIAEDELLKDLVELG